jgi:hypothetical protein
MQIIFLKNLCAVCRDGARNININLGTGEIQGGANMTGTDCV